MILVDSGWWSGTTILRHLTNFQRLSKQTQKFCPNILFCNLYLFIFLLLSHKICLRLFKMQPDVGHSAIFNSSVRFKCRNCQRCSACTFLIEQVGSLHLYENIFVHLYSKFSFILVQNKLSRLIIFIVHWVHVFFKPLTNMLTQIFIAFSFCKQFTNKHYVWNLIWKSVKT